MYMEEKTAKIFQSSTVQREIFEWCKILHISNTCKLCKKLEPTKIFTQDCEITRFLLAQQLFVYYATPDVPVSMVASYHRLDGAR